MPPSIVTQVSCGKLWLDAPVPGRSRYGGCLRCSGDGVEKCCLEGVVASILSPLLPGSIFGLVSGIALWRPPLRTREAGSQVLWWDELLYTSMNLISYSLADKFRIASRCDNCCPVDVTEMRSQPGPAGKVVHTYTWSSFIIFLLKSTRSDYNTAR